MKKLSDSLTEHASDIPAFQRSWPHGQYYSVPAFQASWLVFRISAFQRSTMEEAMLNFSSESSDEELVLKCRETVISKIISDQQTYESPSPQYWLCYLAESGSDSDENCSLFPEVFNISSQTNVKVKCKDKEQSALLLSMRICCRYPNCQLTFEEMRYMEEHYCRKHSEIKVSCSACGQSFNHRSGLHRHRKRNCWKQLASNGKITFDYLGAVDRGSYT